MRGAFESAVIRLTDVQACEITKAKFQGQLQVKLCLQALRIPPSSSKNHWKNNLSMFFDIRRESNFDSF